MKFLFYLSLFFLFSYAEEIITFETRQNTITNIKEIIQSEESIARAYEQYILNEKEIPSISDLKTSDYLHSSFPSVDIAFFNNFTLGTKKSISYALKNIFRKNNEKPLGLIELIAIALGGMIGGGIFTILGISVSLIGVFTPLAIMMGGVIASFAAYSYVKLALYYKDEGATYSFFKKTFPNSKFAASLVGWWVVFGYISTIALYAYTFSSYAISSFEFAQDETIRKIIAGLIIFIFATVNSISVKIMGKIEDVLVYTKLIILSIIAFVLINNSNTTLPILLEENTHTNIYLY